MKLMIDEHAIARFVQTGAHGDQRRYYVTNAGDLARCIVVCRDGLDLGDLRGRIVDANVGNECGVPGFVFENEVGLLHSKVTIYRFLGGRSFDCTLSQLLANSYFRER
jgi:hypothetical protein